MHLWPLWTEARATTIRTMLCNLMPLILHTWVPHYQHKYKNLSESKCCMISCSSINISYTGHTQHMQEFILKIFLHGIPSAFLKYIYCHDVIGNLLYVHFWTSKAPCPPLPFYSRIHLRMGRRSPRSRARGIRHGGSRERRRGGGGANKGKFRCARGQQHHAYIQQEAERGGSVL